MYKFIPIKRPMIWGTEYWVLSGYPERVSIVDHGKYKGLTINELIKKEGDALLGKKIHDRFGDEFPLLIKFIDAKDDLSIQVHPDEAMAQKLHGGHGKTEMWYVIKADKDAHIYSGLSKEITKDDYVKLVEANRITDVITRHEVKDGDVFFLPAGRVHAICRGTYLAEVQQTSDITYRIFDYGRIGADGKARELHTEKAKEAIDYKVYPEYCTRYNDHNNDEIPVVNCQYFKTSVLKLTESYEKDLSVLDCFLAVTCTGGKGQISCLDANEQQDTLSLAEGECLLVPATAKKLQFTPSTEGLNILLSSI